jgi:hypothetical protein
MKTHLSGLLSVAAITAVFQSAAAQILDGGLDGTFTPTVNSGGLIYTAIPQPDGSILLGGRFTAVARDSTDLPESRFRIARFFNSGGLDPNYSPNTNGDVYNILVQPDATTFAVGEFDRVNFTSAVSDPTTRIRYRLAKFNSVGAVDQFYAPPLQGTTSIYSLTAAQGGKLLISGRPGFNMLDTDGSVMAESAFAPYRISAQGWAVYGVAMRPDQNFYAYGSFSYLTNYGVNSVYIDRLGQNGRFPVTNTQNQDLQPFNIPGGSMVSNAIHATALLPDGGILIGGIFPGPPGPPVPPGEPLNTLNSTPGFAKLMPEKGAFNNLYAGRLDQAFYDVHKYEDSRPFIDGNVHAIAVQTDGKILIGGSFTKVRSPVVTNGVRRYDTHYGIARLLPNGTLDTTFDAKIQPVPGGNESFVVTGISIQEDGKILITGTFQRFGESVTHYTYQPLIARLMNQGNLATNSLSVSANGSEITWLRGGASPEATEVIFEWRSANSQVWQLVDGIGIGVRTEGGWTRTVTTPIPAFSFVRASARTTGGLYNGSSGMVSKTTAFKVQQVQLSRDPYIPVVADGTSDLGTTGVGTEIDVPFTISNPGSAQLGSISAAVTGPGAEHFTVLLPPASSLAPGDSSPFEVRFKPTSTGTKTGTLIVYSNDPETPQYTVTLTGTAISGIEQFRLTHFGTTSNTGDAADDKDPDGDGLTNFFEYVAGLIPTDRTSTFTCRVDKSGSQPKVVFGPCLNNRNYEVWSSNTLNGDWALAVGTTATVGTQQTFTDSNPSAAKRFYRVKITFP